MQNNVCSDLFWYGDMLLHVWAKNENFKILYTKYVEKSEAIMTSTHSFAYSDRLFKKCFVEIYETS